MPDQINPPRSCNNVLEMSNNSRVIYAPELNFLSKLKPYNIYNLFSNFGNIDLIVFDLSDKKN